LTLEGAPGKVPFESIHRFKGLERPVVVLVDIGAYVEQDNAELLYVGLTRARLHLVVVGAKATIAALGSRADVEQAVGPTRSCTDEKSTRP